MNEPKKSIKFDNPIEYFQNNNLLKYGQQESQRQPFDDNLKGLDFT